MKATVQFHKCYVTNGVEKASVWYSLDNRIDGRKCVTIRAKKCGSSLGRILAGEFVDHTDIITDYFEAGKAVLFENHPLYAAARMRAEA